MPIFNVQVINNTIPNIQGNVLTPSSTGSGISSLTGVSYSQLIASLGTFIYSIYMIYLYSQNTSQINTPLGYYEYDASGNQKTHYLTPVADPYQFSNAIYFNPAKNTIVLNGNSGLNLTVLPNTSLTLQLFSITITNQGDGHNINFAFLENKENIRNFLNYKNTL